jgi:hypothetical protein
MDWWLAIQLCYNAVSTADITPSQMARSMKILYMRYKVVVAYFKALLIPSLKIPSFQRWDE